MEWLIIIGKVGRNQACGNRPGFPPGLELLMEFEVPDLQPLAATQPLPAPTNDKPSHNVMIFQTRGIVLSVENVKWQNECP